MSLYFFNAMQEYEVLFLAGANKADLTAKVEETLKSIVPNLIEKIPGITKYMKMP